MRRPRLERLESRRLLTVIYSDEFPQRQFDPSKWESIEGATIDAVGIAEPSAPFSARFNRHPTGGDVLESTALNLASETYATVSYWYQRTGGGEPPEPDADLVLEFKDVVGDWIELSRHLGDGPDMVEFEPISVDLPKEALHAEFKFRFRLDGDSSLFDDWFIDDVNVSVGPGEIHGRKFNDVDRDGVWGPGDDPLVGWTVYLDLNKNGLLDDGEPSQLTDDEGLYHFTQLPTATYAVSELQERHWVQTLPATPGAALMPVESLVDGFDAEAVNGAWSVVLSSDDRFVYAAAAGDDSVEVFARDEITGELKSLDSIRNGQRGVDWLDGARALVLSPDGKHMYVAASNDDAVVALERDPLTGSLTYISAHVDGIDDVDGLDGVWSVAISPDGRHVYAAGSIDDAVVVFLRDAENGELNFLERYASTAEEVVEVVGLDGARSVLLSPDGAHLYVASSNDNAVTAFARDARTGALAPIETYINEPEGTRGLEGAFALTMSTDGRHLYVASVVDDALTVFARDPLTGELSFVDVEQDNVDGVEGLDFAGDVIVAPDGRHVYATGADDDAIAVFARDDETGELTFAQSIADGDSDLFGVRGIAASADGRHLYTTASLGHAVAAYRVPPVHVLRIISGQVSEEIDFASFVTAPIWRGGGEDDLWSTPDNWLGRMPPVDGDELIFEGTQRLANLDDLPAGTIVRSVEFENGDFVLSGNLLVLDAADGAIIISRDGVNEWRLPLALRSSATVRVDEGALSLWESLDTAEHLVTFLTHGETTIAANGQIVGNGGLIKTGTGTLTLTGVEGAENAYGGETVVEEGVLKLLDWATLGDDVTGAEVLPEATLWIATQTVLTEPIALLGELVLSDGTEFAGNVTFGPDAVLRAVGESTVRYSGMADGLEPAGGVRYESLDATSVLVLAGANTYIGPTFLTGAGVIRLGASQAVPPTSAINLDDETTWQLGGFNAEIASISGGGRVVLDGARLTVGGDGSSAVFAGSIEGAGELEKDGAGTFTLAGSLAHTGALRVAAGELVFDAVATGGDRITVHNGARLTAKGLVRRPIEVYPGGTLSLGAGLVELATDGLTLHSGATLKIEIGATDHDRLITRGQVVLQGGRLQVDMTAPPATKRLLLIENFGADPVVGTFANLPEGALQVINGVQFLITYTGGDGNDVELITIATISGTIFRDGSGERLLPARDGAMSGWVVFIDRNGNGKLERGEPTASTDAAGRYTFRDVQSGTARVTQVLGSAWTQTTPDKSPFVLTFVQARSNGGPVDSLNGAWSSVVSPDGRHVYTVSAIDGALSVFNRDFTSGGVSFVEAKVDGLGGVDGLSGAVSVDVSPDGRHVYAAGLFDNAVAVFNRNQETGRLTFVEVHRDNLGGVDGLADVLSVTVAPDGMHVYAAGNRDNALAVFRRDKTSGALTFVEAVRDGQRQDTKTIDGLDGAWRVVVSPDGQHVYATANLDSALAVFTRDPETGALTYVERWKEGLDGVDSLNGASGLAVSPDGRNVYVTAERDHTVNTFARDPLTGRVTIVDVLRHGVDGTVGLHGVNSVSVSPDGGLVYVTGLTFNSLVAYTRDSQTGLLTFAEMRADGFNEIEGLAGVRAVTVSPDGLHVYTTASVDDTLAVLARDVPYYSVRVNNGQIITGLDFGVRRSGPLRGDEVDIGEPRRHPRDFDFGGDALPQVIVQPAELAITEGDSAASYTVVLASQPRADVRLTIHFDTSQLAVSASQLVFTAEDWDMPRRVLVAAVDDGLAEGLHVALIEHRVSSVDPTNGSATPTSVRVAITDAVVNPGGLPGDTNGDGTVNIDDLNNVRNSFGSTGAGAVGDTNGDGRVDITDLNNVRNNFGAMAAPSLPGDTNGDGRVDITDLNNVRNNFGASGPAAAGDTNGDGRVDITDLNNVRNNFGAMAAAPLPGDTNGDGEVDISDLNNVRNQFGASGPGVTGDANDDGRVDIEDLNAVRNHFGQRAPEGGVQSGQPDQGRLPVDALPTDSRDHGVTRVNRRAVRTRMGAEALPVTHAAVLEAALLAVLEDDALLIPALRRL